MHPERAPERGAGFRWARQQGQGTLCRKRWRGGWGLPRVKGSPHAAWGVGWGGGKGGALKGVTTRLTCGRENQAWARVGAVPGWRLRLPPERAQPAFLSSHLLPRM